MVRFKLFRNLYGCFFLRVYDLKEDYWSLYEDDFSSALPENLRWRNWAIGKAQKDQITGDELVDFINNELFPKMKDIQLNSDSTKRERIIYEMMHEAFNYMKDGVCIRRAVNLLSRIKFDNKAELHEFNDVYETLLKDLQSAGRSGEFYTPRAITRFITEKINPQVGETIADFACGTGGFLIDAVEHLKKQVNSAEAMEVVERSLHGVEKKNSFHICFVLLICCYMVLIILKSVTQIHF